MAVRFVSGACLTLMALAVWYPADNGNFILSPWPIPTVMLAYFVVIVLDNLLVWHGNRTVGKVVGGRGSYSKHEGESGDDSGNGSLEQPREVV